MRVVKSYGTLGGVIVSAPEYDGEEIKNEPVFITFDGLPVPFFIEEFEPRSGVKYYLKLEDIDTLEQAEELVGREIALFDEEEGGQHAIVGYTLKDESGRSVGRITAFEDIPGNPCLEVGDILIPCPDECIISIDDGKRQITLRIAPGLLPEQTC